MPFPRTALAGSIGARFAEQVRRHPQRDALRWHGTTLSYAALGGLADALTRRIIRQVGTSNGPVGILAEQGPLLITAILACLRANKIYVALDAALPLDQLAGIAEEAGLQGLLADGAHHRLALSLGPSDRLVRIADHEDGDAVDVDVDVAADANAYIFFTSGSTGRPKGVVDTHANVLHNVLRYTNTLRIAPSDRLTLLQSAHFSGAVSSMFGALLNGATLCLWDMRGSGLAGLASWIEREKVTIYHSVPSIFREVAASGRDLGSLRVVRLEGDQATHRDAAFFRQACDAHCVLVNGLGATECGLVRQYFVRHDTRVAEGPLPVGYPVPDVEVTVVDEVGNPVADGQIGEIAVTSRYLARGYWRRPDLTAAMFRPAGAGRARTYRSGDLGRRAADGCVVHLGRRDFQHRIGGRQVDIGAVEAALSRLPGVLQAAARTHLTTDDDAILCGYVVGDVVADLPAWRIALRRELPPWSIPSNIAVLDRLPLDANGKVDRKSLPVPQRTLPEAAPLPPRSAVEAAVAGIWATVLGVKHVDVDADFFAAGGDSLRAMRLVAAIDEVLGVALPISSVFDQENTVAAMARRIAASPRGR